MNEAFIVVNPPVNKVELQDILSEFSDSILNSDISEKISLTRRQTYYKEMDELNKRFTEKNLDKSGYFEKVDLAAFYKDILFESEWTISKKITGYYTSYIEEKAGKTRHFVRDF